MTNAKARPLVAPTRKLALTFVLALASTLPIAAAAHDLVLIPEPNGNLTVRFGHPNDWQPADKERLLDLRVTGSAGAASAPLPALTSRGLNLEAANAAPSGTAAMATARYDNGLWVTVPDASGKPVYYNTSKAMLPQATSTMAAIKFAKGLYGTADDQTVFKREAGHLIELVPQRNPATLKPGDTLAVLVKFNGKPLAHVGVELTDAATQTAEGQQKFMTNGSGIAEVPIQRAGLNVVSVDYDKANDGSMGKAMKALPVEKVAMIATYAFQVR